MVIVEVPIRTQNIDDDSNEKTHFNEAVSDFTSLLCSFIQFNNFIFFIKAYLIGYYSYIYSLAF